MIGMSIANYLLIFNNLIIKIQKIVRCIEKLSDGESHYKFMQEITIKVK